MMFEDTYHMIAGPSEGTFKDRGSKFIALAYPVYTENDVKEKLEKLKKDYHDARHHCFAYVLGFDRSAQRYNDDGEPSGTAGRPIIGQIQSKDLTNILLVVVRYFGGTKLGVPGLINAYKSAARNALESADIISMTVKDEYEVSFEYPLMNDVMRIIKDEDLTMVEQDFQIGCRIIFRVRKNNSNRAFERFSNLHGSAIRYLKTV